MTETATLSAKVTDMASYRSARDVAGAPMVPAWQVPQGLGAPPTGTVTFLLTDIEGSTPRWDEAADAMTAAVRRHYDILDAAVTAHGGFRPIEQGEGDSMVAAFPRASDAAAAAVEAQTALTGEQWPPGAQVRVRMALHTGEAQLRDELYYVGPSIIRCARLRALAHGDQILLSGGTAHMLADTLPAGASAIPLGRHRLKGLRTPEHVFQLAHPNLPQTFPPLPTTDEKRTTVPIPLTSFLGREAELAEVAELTQRHRAVSVVGTGGCGKTRLAAQVAGHAVDVYPDGVWWVELAETASPEAVPAAVLAALSLDARGMDPLDRLADYLSERSALLVLDNCEHVIVAAADLVETLLRCCPEIRVLSTSREPLGVPGEVAWRIGPLGLPPEAPEGEESLAEIRGAEAVRLFVDRAATARPGYRLTDADAPVVAAICRRLDGIPLAVELAAARMRVLPPARILDGLRNRFEVAAGGVRGAPARQQTLSKSVEWSFDLLGEPERVLLRRLAVFNGPFDLVAAEAVTPGDGLALGEVLPLLAGLVDKSLVGFDGEHYVLLQTIRDFAGDCLEDAGEVAALRDAHLAHYLTVAATGAAELSANPAVATLAVFDSARTNLLAAIEWALERDDADAAQQVAADLVLFWQLRGLHSESLTTLRQVLARTPDQPSPARARVLAGVGQLAFYGMDMANGYGVADNEVAIEMATAHGEDEVLGRALAMRSFGAMFMAPETGLEIIREARAVATRAQDPYGQTVAAAYGAFIATFGCSNAQLAEPHLAELAKAQSGSPLWPMWAGLARGIDAWRTGRLDEAIDLLTAAEELCWEIGDPTMESWCAVWLAEAHVDRGEYAAADRVLTRSANWMARSSCGRHEFVLSRRIRLALAQGDLATAASYFPLLDTTVCTMGFALVNIEVECLRATIALASGDLAAARVAVDDAGKYPWEAPWYLAMIANIEGVVARAEGRSGAAEDAHHCALALCLKHGFDGAAAETLERLGALALAGESPEEAVRLFGAAGAIRARTGRKRFALEAITFDADLAAAHAALGEAAFDAALAEGAALGLDEAVAYASRARGERKRPSAGWDSLTPTERQVVELAATGLTNAQIAEKLFIATGTVKIHVHHIFTKLGINRRAELAALATERRLTEAAS